jgi:alkanesulfonate monooxygenase SsuD/methylene tetrahydromethanopterin reductase-like flavin-dependent oxidoreductase (luciferase family)
MGVEVKISIALPNTIPGAPGPLQVDWAVKAEQRGFTSLAATERLVYPGHAPLLTLAAAAAVTSRIGLFSNILIGPLRSTAVLAKEAATLDSLSGGRFTLGLAPGVRGDDFDAAERDFAGRGEVFDRQLKGLRRIWSGSHGQDDGAVGPPASVPLLVGGTSAAAVRRTVCWADGWTAPGLDPELILPLAERVRTSWTQAGRDGLPRLVALLRFSLGDDVAEESSAFVRNYFAILGDNSESFVEKTPRTPAHIRDQVCVLADAGVSEVIFHPTAARLSQVDRLADILL